ncbi:hypothetical protein ACFQUU_08640 [Herbaspirillum sp. GCM10030257]|uniref:hypothetical protein n=1 Tax=Herbaspirillum sp. GCM10030257 TaxID=3273393 RepID=UPI00361A0763
MNETFEVGEIAIVQHAATGPCEHLNGTECEVIEVWGRPFRINGITYKYLIRCVDGDLYNAASYHLRKKRPPQQFEGELRIMRMFNSSPVERTSMEPA